MGDPDIAHPPLLLHPAQRRQMGAPVHEIVDLHQVDDFGAQQLSRAPICSIPRSRPVVHTLVARKLRDRAPESASRSPVTASARPYLGEGSMIRPPSSSSPSSPSPRQPPPVS